MRSLDLPSQSTQQLPSSSSCLALFPALHHVALLLTNHNAYHKHNVQTRAKPSHSTFRQFVWVADEERGEYRHASISQQHVIVSRQLLRKAVTTRMLFLRSRQRNDDDS